MTWKNINILCLHWCWPLIVLIHQHHVQYIFIRKSSPSHAVITAKLSLGFPFIIKPSWDNVVIFFLWHNSLIFWLFPDCDHFVSPPLATKPSDNTTTFKQLPSRNITLECSGFYTSANTCTFCTQSWIKYDPDDDGSVEFFDSNSSSRIYSTQTM